MRRLVRGRVRAACDHPLDYIRQLRAELVEEGRPAHEFFWVHLVVDEADVVTEHVPSGSEAARARAWAWAKIRCEAEDDYD